MNWMKALDLNKVWCYSNDGNLIIRDNASMHFLPANTIASVAMEVTGPTKLGYYTFPVFFRPTGRLTNDSIILRFTSKGAAENAIVDLVEFQSNETFHRVRDRELRYIEAAMFGSANDKD